MTVKKKVGFAFFSGLCFLFIFFCLLKDVYVFYQNPLQPYAFLDPERKSTGFSLKQPAPLSLVWIIPEHSSAKDLANALGSRGLIKRPLYFIYLSLFLGYDKQLKAGRYRIHETMRFPELMRLFASGGLKTHRITLVEGWRFSEVEKAFLKHPEFPEFKVRACTKGFSMKELGQPLTSPEGWFFPDTYFFQTGDCPSDVLRQAHQTMKRRLSRAWETRKSGLPYETPYQALIAASLIEKETAYLPERPLVASVIVNRLKKGMRLQIDPTAIYGAGGGYEGRLTRTQLNQLNPYNTYQVFGLPPTPIGLVSGSALQSALNPEDSDFLYFVAKGDGSHQFSATLAEQTAAIRHFMSKAERP